MHAYIRQERTEEEERERLRNGEAKRRWRREEGESKSSKRGSERGGAEKSEKEGYTEKEDRRSSSSKTHPVAFQSLSAVLLLLLEAAAALALVEYVRRELPALGAGATDARRATRHRDTCELTTTVGQHRLLSSSFCHCLSHLNTPQTVATLPSCVRDSRIVVGPTVVYPGKHSLSVFKGECHSCATARRSL